MMYGLFEIPKATGKNRRKIAQLRNLQTWWASFSDLVLDALHRYDIEGIPDTCSKKLVLQSLLWYGSVVFFKEGETILALPGHGTDEITAYGDYRYAYVWSMNGRINKKVNLALPYGIDGNAVMIRENELIFPFINLTMQFADYIADTYRTLDIARRNIKVPYLITAEEEIVQTVKKYLESIDENSDAILSTGIFPADRINIFPIATSTESLRAGTALVDWYKSHYKILCGIPANLATDKKGENLISGELDIDSGYADFVAKRLIDYMTEQLDFCNDILGTKMSIKRGYEDERAAEDEVLPDRRDDTN